ncbi:MAG TPA: YggT family protein [Burkholderiaceae bacterium]|nr:YggT family protein [Burkholderiaceae bacterium]HQR75563.1 YggT family protein [Burkholderiaceae bacterium]
MLFVDIARALLDIIGSLLVGVLLLRCWATFIGMPARNPLAHFSRVLTDWLVRPLAKLIPSRGRIEWAALFAALVLSFAIVVLKVMLAGLSLAWDLALIEAVRQLLNWALSLIIWVTLIYVIISWVNPLAPVAPALSMLLRPLLGPIQRILPVLGGIDLSPMVLLIIVYVLQMVVARAVF